MKFDISNNISSIFSDNSLSSSPIVPNESKFDRTFPSEDEASSLAKSYEETCPITGKVFNALKEAAADPSNLKTVYSESSTEGVPSKLYIEALEFVTFTEAADFSSISEAEDAIIDYFKSENPDVEDEPELHVVFPSEAPEKNILGSMNNGTAVKNDWASQLMSGCRHYGIKTNCGVSTSEGCCKEGCERKTITEAADPEKTERALVGKKIKAVLVSKFKEAAKVYKETHKDMESKRKDPDGQWLSRIDFIVNDREFVNGTSDEIKLPIFNTAEFAIGTVAAGLLGAVIGIVAGPLAPGIAIAAGVGVGGALDANNEYSAKAANSNVSANKKAFEKELSDATGYKCTISALKNGSKLIGIIVTCKK